MSENFFKKRENRESIETFAIPTEAERIAYPFYYPKEDGLDFSEQKRVTNPWLRIFTKFCPEYNAHRLSAFNTKTIAMLMHWGLKGEKRRQAWELNQDKKKQADINAWREIQPLADLSIVDFASGDEGTFVELLNLLGASARGIDINSKSALVYEMRDLIPRAATLKPVVDAVLATNMYEDLYGTTFCSREWGNIANSILKPGGLIIVSEIIPGIVGDRDIFPGVKKDPAMQQKFQISEVPCQIERKIINI